MKKPLFLVAMLLGLSAFAQNSYTLSTYNSTYTELTNPTPVEFMFDDGEPWDDSFFTVPFGFNFQIGGETFTSTSQLGSGALMGFGDILDPGLEELTFFGLNDDLVDGATIEGLDSSFISYTVTGLPNNKIAKIQYKNAAFYAETASPEPAAENRINFQIWFYEDDGIMEIHYGESNIPDPQMVFYGNDGPGAVLVLGLNFDGETLDYGAAIFGDPTSPSLAEFTIIPEDEEQAGLSGIPASGRVHRLAPSNPLGIFNVKAPEFSVYPTITESELWVKGETNANANYRIMDITGKQVLAGRMQNQNVINVSNLNAGVYLFSIDGMSSAAKFIKK